MATKVVAHQPRVRLTQVELDVREQMRADRGPGSYQGNPPSYGPLAIRVAALSEARRMRDEYAERQALIEVCSTCEGMAEKLPAPSLYVGKRAA